jgi:hypothetical protein
MSASIYLVQVEELYALEHNVTDSSGQAAGLVWQPEHRRLESIFPGGLDERCQK